MKDKVQRHLEISHRNHQISNLRHRLYKVSPLVFCLTSIYILMNIIVGTTMAIAFDETRVVTSLLIVNDILTYKVWGGIFLGLAAFQFFALARNDWGLIKKALLAGVVVKSFWAVGLILRAVVDQGTLLIALPWVALALIQIATVVFFLPPVYDFREVDDEVDNRI